MKKIIAMFCITFNVYSSGAFQQITKPTVARALRQSFYDYLKNMKTSATQNVRNDFLTQEKLNDMRRAYDATKTPSGSWYEKARTNIKNFFEYQNKKSDALHEYVHGQKPDFLPKEGPLFDKQEKLKDLKELLQNKALMSQLLGTIGLGMYIEANHEN